MSNAANIEAIRNALTPAVETVLQAQAVADVLRKEINGYAVQALAEGDYRETTLARNGAEVVTSKRITDPADAWLMPEAQAAIYYPRLAELTAAAGYDVSDGRCPALVAESAVRSAKEALSEVARVTIPGCEHMTVDQILCGTKRPDGSRECGLKTYARWIDSLLHLGCPVLA